MRIDALPHSRATLRAQLLARTSRRAEPGSLDELGDALDSVVELDRGEQGRAVVAHLVGVALHHRQRSAYVRRQVNLRQGQSQISNCSASELEERGEGEGLVTLLTMRRSDWEMPGPPLRGILSPPETSI